MISPSFFLFLTIDLIVSLFFNKCPYNVVAFHVLGHIGVLALSIFLRKE